MKPSGLPRVLEPEVMDSAEDARDYDSMDHAEVNRRFVADFLATDPDVGRVLDVGTGTARIPIELCRTSPSVRVVGIDLAPHMLHVAEWNVEREGLRDRVALQVVDAKGLPFDDGTFTAVISNSIVHHVPDPFPVLAEALRVTAPGGVIFFRDLSRPADETTWRRLVETYAAGCNDHQRRLFGDSLRAALTVDEVREIVASLGYAAEGVRPTSDRHWTWIGRRRV